MQFTSIDNLTHPLVQPLKAGICNRFSTRLKGYMFHSPIGQADALLFIQSGESRVDASIHMFFVSFDLAVIWLDSSRVVVDRCLARSWRPFYMPSKPAGYILETHPAHLDAFQVGDQLVLSHV